MLPVLSLPLDEEWQIDSLALRREIDWLLELGCDGVVIGMVSEILRLDLAERERFAELVVSEVGGRGATVIAVSAESTPGATRLATHAARIGATAVMANAPITSLADPASLESHFVAIAEASGALPVVVQDASGYVGRPLSMRLMLRLLDEFGPDKAQFKPEAIPLGPRVSELIETSGGRARVFEGSGGLALVESARRGAVGTMPGSDVAWAIVAMWRALRAGDLVRADEVGAGVAALLSHVSALDRYIAVEKHLLVEQGVFTSARRFGPGMAGLDPITKEETVRLMQRLQRIVGRTDQWKPAADVEGVHR
ncbi:dihydrodipicolinate synthetase [Beutenbergia cavernae DSM 12333]|uniref:Dihydrodipicolinate synthetase n=1 Tax=Beutenbergia cavernae (strain ATCC BAA-8 / DSM 12333 / CCUG 43141 / JCM 11478 / NBRC 16432 / NCIMB 13614 / HKI 0122) TaxID=471853 RepID=C5BZP0_BEUC1|nr:dihydrodipicolinate synthase family protein [Beutenbergia cavernae]ACQ81220.1 dihydrodipicolinate synthetase [Beutenbergia cavernae DSM 12333]